MGVNCIRPTTAHAGESPWIFERVGIGGVVLLLYSYSTFSLHTVSVQSGLISAFSLDVG